MRVVIELEDNIPMDYLVDWVRELRKYRYVRDVNIEASVGYPHSGEVKK